MAQYKVPQDVEADDKLLGPFSFRQFVYLLIAGGCIALAVALFQLFPLLAIIPILPALFFMVLALPLKKDQPMETYLAAIVSYYLKPRTRIWVPGQKESTIKIGAPKVVDETRARDITGEEATHRLSFLADIVDTEGQAIKNNLNRVNDQLVAEANATTDMFETMHFDNLESTIAKDENARHEEVMKEMREAIRKNENEPAPAKNEAVDNNVLLEENKQDSTTGDVSSEEQKVEEQDAKPEEVKLEDAKPEEARPEKLEPDETKLEPQPAEEKEVDKPKEEKVEKSEKPVENHDEKNEVKSEKVKEIKAKPSIIELANNADFSVATIAKEANRIKERDEGEVFISLH
ncbi:PrgI family protein [Candidatus Saccharibacteria bacterium]|nr:PrgI family protein [Candidatus Saccharibacteria bacterium]